MRGWVPGEGVLRAGAAPAGAGSPRDSSSCCSPLVPALSRPQGDLSPRIAWGQSFGGELGLTMCRCPRWGFSSCRGLPPTPLPPCRAEKQRCWPWAAFLPGSPRAFQALIGSEREGGCVIPSYGMGEESQDVAAPGVGVRGRIRPPGIPSSAVTPRGFSSLSHECDAVAARREWGCSWIWQENLQREDSALLKTFPGHRGGRCSWR